MVQPVDLINRALDQIGSDVVIGDPKEGTPQAQVALRAYGPALRQLLRTAHWDFARKVAPMTLLADSTGQTPNVGKVVISPFQYEYALPIDCVKARFVPFNNNQGSTANGGVTTLAQAITSTTQGTMIVASVQNFPTSGQYNVTIDSETLTVVQGQGTLQQVIARGVNGTLAATHALGATVTMLPVAPIMTGINDVGPWGGGQLKPARFLLSLDYNYPVVTGAPSAWGQQAEWWETYGEGPQQRTVVLTNVKNASMVYTALVLYPSQWDDLFAEALVQLLASRLALPLSKDKKFGLTLRRDAIANCKAMITEARLVSANESGFPQSTDMAVDWMRIRNAGAGWGAEGFGNNAGPGIWFGAFDGIGFGDGSVF